MKRTRKYFKYHLLNTIDRINRNRVVDVKLVIFFFLAYALIIILGGMATRDLINL